MLAALRTLLTAPVLGVVLATRLAYRAASLVRVLAAGLPRRTAGPICELATFLALRAATSRSLLTAYASIIATTARRELTTGVIRRTATVDWFVFAALPVIRTAFARAAPAVRATLLVGCAILGRAHQTALSVLRSTGVPKATLLIVIITARLIATGVALPAATGDLGRTAYVAAYVPASSVRTRLLVRLAAFDATLAFHPIGATIPIANTAGRLTAILSLEDW